MASLCEICQSIPFKNLPPIPDNFGSYVPEGPKSNIYKLFWYGSEENAEGPSIGWTHSKSLKQMNAESEACVLCKLLTDPRGQLARDYAEAEVNENFASGNQTQGLSDGPLGLLARVDGSDGFMLILRAKNPKFWFVVTVVGLCVDEG
jgi:hypothetical protein